MGRTAPATGGGPRGRNERLEVRIPAELQGRTLSDLVIASVHEAAVRAINAAQTIRLNKAESLLDP